MAMSKGNIKTFEDCMARVASGLANKTSRKHNPAQKPKLKQGGKLVVLYGNRFNCFAGYRDKTGKRRTSVRLLNNHNPFQVITESDYETDQKRFNAEIAKLDQEIAKGYQKIAEFDEEIGRLDEKIEKQDEELEKLFLEITQLIDEVAIEEKSVDELKAMSIEQLFGNNK